MRVHTYRVVVIVYGSGAVGTVCKLVRVFHGFQFSPEETYGNYFSSAAPRTGAARQPSLSRNVYTAAFGLRQKFSIRFPGVNPIHEAVYVRKSSIFHIGRSIPPQRVRVRNAVSHDLRAADIYIYE